MQALTSKRTLQRLGPAVTPKRGESNSELERCTVDRSEYRGMLGGELIVEDNTKSPALRVAVPAQRPLGAGVQGSDPGGRPDGNFNQVPVQPLAQWQPRFGGVCHPQRQKLYAAEVLYYVLLQRGSDGGGAGDGGAGGGGAGGGSMGRAGASGPAAEEGELRSGGGGHSAGAAAAAEAATSSCCLAMIRCYNITSATSLTWLPCLWRPRRATLSRRRQGMTCCGRCWCPSSSPPCTRTRAALAALPCFLSSLSWGGRTAWHSS